MSSKPIEEVLARYTPQWITLEGVVGTGLGLHQGEPYILVFVAERRTPGLEEKIPPEVEGHPVVVEQTGRFRAWPGGGTPPGGDPLNTKPPT